MPKFGGRDLEGTPGSAPSHLSPSLLVVPWMAPVSCGRRRGVPKEAKPAVQSKIMKSVMMIWNSDRDQYFQNKGLISLHNFLLIKIWIICTGLQAIPKSWLFRLMWDAFKG